MPHLTRPVVALAALAGLALPALAQTELLPDIITEAATLNDWDIVQQGGRTLLRLSNSTPNRGLGRLHLYGGAVVGSQQQVWQRIFRTDGTFTDRLAGTFTYHPGHGHIHYDNWCAYRLREVTAGGGVGPVVREGAKISFCILDLAVYDSSNPNFRSPGFYPGCGSTVQGLTPGWKDIYGKTLEGQNIDITGVPNGQYWLESEVDPDNSVVESDETNNISRIRITLGGTGGFDPDRYEPNDTAAAVAAMPSGRPNLPNLGPVFPSVNITGLNIHVGGNEDFYRFYMAGAGAAGDRVHIEFNHSAGDVDMTLLNAAGTQLASSTGVTNSEEISLSGRPRGWYTVRVYGFNNARNPDYTLSIDPAASAQPPAVTVHEPEAGNVVRVIGLDTQNVRWTAQDPDSDPTWVTVLVNTTQSLTGAQTLLDTINTPGNAGIAVINSAYLTPGTYHVYVQITDGGAIRGAWAPGTVTFVPQCRADLNADGELTFDDIQLFVSLYNTNDPRADFNDDQEWTFDDIQLFVQQYNAGC